MLIPSLACMPVVLAALCTPAVVGPSATLAGVWSTGPVNEKQLTLNADGGGSYVLRLDLPLTGEGWDCSCTNLVLVDLSWSATGDSLKLVMGRDLRSVGTVDLQCPVTDQIAKPARVFCEEATTAHRREFGALRELRVAWAYTLAGDELTLGVECWKRR